MIYFDPKKLQRSHKKISGLSELKAQQRIILEQKREKIAQETISKQLRVGRFREIQEQYQAELQRRDQRKLKKTEHRSLGSLMGTPRPSKVDLESKATLRALEQKSMPALIPGRGLIERSGPHVGSARQIQAASEDRSRDRGLSKLLIYRKRAVMDSKQTKMRRFYEERVKNHFSPIGNLNKALAVAKESQFFKQRRLNSFARIKLINLLD